MGPRPWCQWWWTPLSMPLTQYLFSYYLTRACGLWDNLALGKRYFEWWNAWPYRNQPVTFHLRVASCVVESCDKNSCVCFICGTKHFAWLLSFGLICSFVLRVSDCQFTEVWWRLYTLVLLFGDNTITTALIKSRHFTTERLTHWGRDKMVAIFQTFSNAFSWMKIYEFRLSFHLRLFPRVQLTIFQHWFR